MRRKGTLLLGVAAACAFWGPLAAQQREECGGGVRTALVLSGGGAKGIAHIEVIRALDSLGARPDFIVGTSMGAIIGALYASGYSGRAIDSIARAGRPRQLFENREPRTPHAWLPMAPQLVWEQGTGGFSLQSPTVREPEANAALSAMLLRGNLLARGNFDSLPIPFRAVATDLETRAPVLLARGDLAQSVRASIAVPLVFPPQRIAGKVLTDGGLSANVPIGLARRLGADRVIVSDVGGRLLHADELTNPLAVADQLVTFLFQQQADTLGAGDVYIKTDVEGFSTLDFSDKAMDSLRINGRRAADSVLARAGCLPRAPLIPGAVPRHTGPFSVEGIRRAEGAVLEEILGLRPGSALSEEELRRRLAGLPTMEQYKAVWLNPGGSADEASFRLAVEPASRRLAGAAFAYDNTLSGRLGVAYIDQRFLGIPLEASGRLALSPLHDDFGFGFRRYFGVGRSRLAPTLTGYLSRERIIRYDAEGEELGRPLTREGVLFAGLQRDFGSDWILNLGFDGRIWRDADTLGGQTTNGLTGQSGGLLFRAMHQPGSAFVLAEAVWSGNFRRLQTDLDVDLHSGKLTLTPRARLGWGEFLPLQSTFPLGGDDGFPGLNIHERRGDREAMVSLQGTWMLEGPLSLRMLLAAGRSAYGGGLFSGEDWLGGLRAGLGVETPVGPVRAEYGFATNGRSSLLLRIGRWF